jgi:hypothetical protein
VSGDIDKNFAENSGSGSVRMIRRAANQHEAAVTIAAFDIAALVDLKKNTRMAKRCPGGDVTGAVAHHSGGGDTDRFGLVRAHGCAHSKAPVMVQSRAWRSGTADERDRHGPSPARRFDYSEKCREQHSQEQHYPRVSDKAGRGAGDHMLIVRLVP